MKSAEISLPYFKQGDDLHLAIKNTNNISEALEEHSSCLLGASDILLKIKEFIEKYNADNDKNYANNEIEINADCHFISIFGPEDFIDNLIKVGLAQESPFEDEDEDEDEEDLAEEPEED